MQCFQFETEECTYMEPDWEPSHMVGKTELMGSTTSGVLVEEVVPEEPSPPPLLAPSLDDPANLG